MPPTYKPGRKVIIDCPCGRWQHTFNTDHDGGLQSSCPRCNRPIVLPPRGVGEK